MENMEKELEERELMTTEEDMDENNNENREFYVYEHIRLDNNTCFYVGKGHGNRAYNLDRSNFHNSIRDEYGCRVEIIKDGLTEEEAFKLETERIEDYVITFGYGIPIDGYRDFSNNKYLTNFTWGGEGTSGLNAFANKTPEEMEIIGRKMSEKSKGRNPYANKTEEEMEIIRGKMSESHKGKQTGKNNHFYGKHHSEEAKRKNSEAHKGKNSFENKTKEEMETIVKKISEKLSKKVICITTGEIFNSIKKAGDYYNVAKNTISKCCKEKYKSAGKLPDGTKLQWKYVKDYNNDFKGILINPIIE